MPDEQLKDFAGDSMLRLYEPETIRVEMAICLTFE